MIGQRVLLISGNPDAREIFRLALEHAGYTVFTAETAERGLARAREVAPEVIVSEFPLLLQDGVSLLETVRAEPRLNRARLCALTSVALSSVFDTARAAGAEVVLLNPVSPSQLVRTVGRLVGSGDIAPEELPQSPA